MHSPCLPRVRADVRREDGTFAAEKPVLQHFNHLIQVNGPHTGTHQWGGLLMWDVNTLGRTRHFCVVPPKMQNPNHEVDEVTNPNSGTSHKTRYLFPLKIPTP